jgi:threonine/homoserine/homoserine lactone efflux protein
MSVALKNENSFKSKIIFADTISYAVLLIFLYTSVSKLIDFHAFNLVLHRSPILHPIAGLLSWTIIVAEIFISILLVLPEKRRVGLQYASLLLSSFTLYLIYMLFFMPNLPCSCGGIVSELSWFHHVLVNAGLMFLCWMGVKIYKRERELDRSPPDHK